MYSIIKNAKKPTVAVSLAPAKTKSTNKRYLVNSDYSICLVAEDYTEYNRIKK